MKKCKRALALAVALCTVFSVTACGKSDESSSKHEDVVSVQDTSLVDSMDEELSEEDRTIKWMGTYDLNPTGNNETSVEMSLFQEKGGKVEWIRVSDSQKFEKLAAAITSNTEVPDIFKYEWMAFPCQVTKGMYQPIDSIVDFDSDIWSDVKQGADKFVLNGEHYVAPISYATGVLMMYDKDVIDEEGLDDPYEMYLDGNWNWDTWRGLMDEYVSNAQGEVTRYGVAGWFAPQIIQQTGETLVNYEDGVFTSNLMNAEIERAETFIYNLTKDGLVYTDWVDNAKTCLGTMDNILFYVMGSWAMTGNNGPSEGDDWGIVPIPADPNTGAKITTSDMTAYMWVIGSEKDEAVKTWFECAHIAATKDEYKEAGKQKFLIDNPQWTEEMYGVIQDTSSSEYEQVFDYAYGISALLSDDNSATDDTGACVTRKLYEYVTKTNADGTQYTWAELRSTYSNTVDEELKKINDTIASMS